MPFSHRVASMNNEQLVVVELLTRSNLQNLQSKKDLPSVTMRFQLLIIAAVVMLATSSQGKLNEASSVLDMSFLLMF